LLLLTTSPSYEFLLKAQKIVEEKGTPEMKEITAVLWEGKFESQEQLSRFYEIMAPMYAVTHNAHASVAEKQQVLDARARSNRSYEALNQGFGGFLKTFDLRDELPNITAPTLIMGARHDWITPVEESVEIAQRIPNSELVIFENSSHSVIKDEKEKYMDAVISFIKRRILPAF